MHVGDSGGGVHGQHDKCTKKIGDYFDDQYENYLPLYSNQLDALDDLTDDILTLSGNLKPALLENSVKGTVVINDFWNTITFGTLIN